MNVNEATKMKAITESRFEYRGYKCAVVFQPMGHRCGYVALPKTDDYYREKYMVIPVECHGGLTYSEKFLINEEKDGKTIQGEYWWIGFDCAHYRDKNDWETFARYWPERYKEMVENDYPFYFSSYSIVWTQEMVEAECKKIVDQLIELEGVE